jgi:hypothetical protein
MRGHLEQTTGSRAIKKVRGSLWSHLNIYDGMSDSRDIVWGRGIIGDTLYTRVREEEK